MTTSTSSLHGTNHTPKHSHRNAILLMILAPALWSIAGVFTRHLDAARSFEITFWRSFFAAIFVAAYLLWQGNLSTSLRKSGRWGWFSGVLWSVMFSAFMVAMSMTTVANTLVVLSIGPLLTALLAFFILKQTIAPRTWAAIFLAMVGIVIMFANGMNHSNQMWGMLIALCVPIAGSINLIALKKAGAQVDLIPALLIGGLLSCAATLPFSLPMQASLHDILILAMLGVFQLGVPCILMLKASRHLSAPELSLLALLEVLLGPLWAWLGAGEVPHSATLYGGALVLVALVGNEMLAMRKPAS